MRNPHIFPVFPVLVALCVLSFSACDIVRPEEGLEVSAYEGPAIDTTSMSQFWSGEFLDAEVLLTGPSPLNNHGRNAGFVCLSTFTHDDPLPDLTDVWCGPSERDGLGTKIKNAHVWIAEWNPHGVISGKIKIYDRVTHPVAQSFWVDLARQE